MLGNFTAVTDLRFLRLLCVSKILGSIFAINGAPGLNAEC
jgi:hypothetical protein